MAAVRSPIGKEWETMKNILKKFKNMKYRHKLTILLVVVSLVPVTVISLYGHMRMSRLVRENEMEEMNSILKQTKEGIDSQVQIYTSLMNYLTYSPDIEEIIAEKNMDSYLAYERYTEVVDPLLTVPKSYHDAILQIQLFAKSIKVRHGYTLIPMKEIEEEWWEQKLKDEVSVQWLVNREKKEIAAVRKIYKRQDVEAALCITLDYDKVFRPFENILMAEDTGGVIVDEADGDVCFIDNQEEGKSEEEILKEIQENYAYVNVKSSETGWNYYLYKSHEAISAAVFHVLLSEIPLILLCVAGTVLLGVYFSRLFTRKIEELTENMNQVNNGSREVTVFSDSEDEVGLLVRSFRNMMEEINRLIHEVYENKIALKEFELKALTAQINPHFLYNTLSIINWMAIKAGQRQISKVTLALSTFYRTALSKGADMVTVENCIQNIKAYLEIQLVMHDNNFLVEWQVEPEIKNEIVPKLALQPVVENALEHGLDVKEGEDKCLKLYFVEDGEDILMAVEDNGHGMEQEEAESLVTYQTSGYGLKNVNDRICLLYGEEYKIRIYSKTGQGTRVEIRIPKGGAVHGKEKK
ncbi:MAG: sensor histidine kinase [Eubacteriales bacterium]|nr:sensor histidine kinase [Eubacteriales bacterium]